MAQPKPIVPYRQSKDRLDRVVETTANFDTFHIETSKIETLLLLLKCNEEDIQVQVLEHLNCFGIKAPANYIELFKKHLVDIILENKLYDSEYLYIQRFSFKIMAHLINITEDGMSIKHTMVNNEELFELVKNKFLTRNDHFLVEYLTILMVKFCDEPRCCNELIQNDEILLKMHKWLLKTRDSDIFVNLINILYKLTLDPYGLLKISSPTYIPFEVVLASLKSKFPSIQSASLKLFSNIVTSKEFDQFLNTKFFDMIFKILENFLWIDLHVDAIQVIQNVANNTDVAKKLYQNTYLVRLLNYYTKMKENRINIIGIFDNLTQYEDARDILYRQGYVAQLLELVREHPSVSVVHSIGSMAEHYEALEDILHSNVIKDLLDLLQDPTKDWEIRTCVVQTLIILLRLDKKFCMDLIENDGSKCIEPFFEPSMITRQSEILFKLIKLINIMSTFEDLRPKFMTENLAGNLEKSITKISGTKGLTLLCELINCVSLYISEPVMQDALVQENLSQWIVSGLKHHTIKVQSTVNDFIKLTACYSKFCNEYVYGDVLKFLLEHKEAICDCPNWSAAIDAILANHLMVKFAVRGCLDFNDVTTDGFYCSKKHFNDFKTLIEIMDVEVSPLHPIYLVNFHHDQIDKDKCIQLLDGSMDDESLPYDRCPADVFLPRYLEKIREEFDFYGLTQLKKIPDYFDMSDIKKRIEIIAKLVVDELTPSLLSEDDCFDHAFELHLRELKMELHCNIIPLGQLNAGGLFERALLFKVLADQVGIPCKLRLGIDNITSWNEISLYIPRKYMGISLLPRAYLESTHLVDLQNFPGTLYPINCVESWEYRKLNCSDMK